MSEEGSGIFLGQRIKEIVDTQGVDSFFNLIDDDTLELIVNYIVDFYGYDDDSDPLDNEE